MNYARPSFKWYLRGMVRNTLNTDILKWEMDGRGVDFIHHPFTVLTPLGTGIPAVLTFWDMQHEFFPDFFDRIELQRRRLNYKASAEEARRIIVSASFTKDCLVERYGIHTDKIDVIHTGYSPHYRVIDNQKQLQQIREQYGLDRPFLYYPAATWPHKNHHNLLESFKILVERYRFEGDLVLTGIAMQAHNKLLSEIRHLGLADRVKLPGYLPAEVLPCIYNLARMMVFPSLFEGFGIPLVEAMASGCPIVCANSTSLPEVAGDAGVLFDPCSAEDMANKISGLWHDEAALESMRQRGIERAKLFTWEETVRKTLLVYAKVGGATQ
jgi:glycosyltransferase involved in cell wall biosynthesis